MGEPAPQLQRDGERRSRGDLQRHQRNIHARSVPRLGRPDDTHRDDLVITGSQAPSDAELVDFVYREARLIDEKRLDEWYELFTDDGLYWMPLVRGQPDG